MQIFCNSFKRKSLEPSFLSLKLFLKQSFKSRFKKYKAKEEKKISGLCNTLPNVLLEKQFKKSQTTKISKETIVKNYQKNSENLSIFWNCTFDKGRLKSFVSWFLKTYGEHKTIELLEQLKNLGFGYATKAGISLGIDDLKIPPQKFELLYNAEYKIQEGIRKYRNGQITAVERLQQLIDTWNETSENLKQEVIRYFEITDIFNPVYMMAFSGARGNVSQVRQLVGMRGLMSDPQGNIIDFPIQSNFREGLTLTEYIISTYGARKGIVDTALRTATAGYLTRRLVDVAQHVMISEFDCKTTRGIFLFDMKDGNQTIYSFPNRLVGRVLANDIFVSDSFSFEENKTTGFAEQNQSLNKKHNKTKIGYRNQEISSSLAASIAKITKKAFVRSALTCETRQLVCQLCYGWSLSNNKLVSLGEAVGVIAAQSIGEPGTQLTMRTFHTGGVFSGGLTDQIIAPYDGYVEYFEAIPGTCIRTPQGQIAFLTKAEGSFFIQKKLDGVGFEASDFKTKFQKQNINTENLESRKKTELYKIPGFAILFARNKQQVSKKQIVAQFSTVSQQKTQRGNAEQTVYADLTGQIYYNQIDLLEQKNVKLLDDVLWKTNDWAKIWILSGKIYYDPLTSNAFPKKGDFINKNSVFQKVNWYSLNQSFFEVSSNITENLEKQQKSKLVNNKKSKSTLYSQNKLFTRKIPNFEINNSFWGGAPKRTEKSIGFFNRRLKSSKNLKKVNTLNSPGLQPKNFYKQSIQFPKKVESLNITKTTLFSKNIKNNILESISKIVDLDNFSLLNLEENIPNSNISLTQNMFNYSNYLFMKFFNRNKVSKKIFLYQNFWKKSKQNVIPTTNQIQGVKSKHWSNSFSFTTVSRRQHKNQEIMSYKLLEMNGPNPFFYPYNTRIHSSVFKKLNRIDLLSNRFHKKISKKFSKSKEEQIRNLMNPFVIKSSIPNFFRKKTIQKKLLNKKIPFLPFLLSNSFSSNNSAFEASFFIKTKTSQNIYPKDLMSLSNEASNAFNFVKSTQSLKNKAFYRKTKHLNTLNMISHPLFKNIHNYNLTLSHDLNKKQKRIFLNSVKTNNSKPLVLKFSDFQKSSLWNNKKNGKKSNSKNKIDVEKNFQNYVMKTPLLFVPLTNVAFKKLGYTFSVPFYRFSTIQQTAQSKTKTIQSIPKSKNMKFQTKADQFFSFFPLTNSSEFSLNFSVFETKFKNKVQPKIWNSKIDFFSVNDPGKSFQKLSLGNTQQWGPFPNLAFNWFPFEYKTIHNGIFIWPKNNSLNFLSLQNNFWIQKKRWITNGTSVKKKEKKTSDWFISLQFKDSSQNIRRVSNINLCLKSETFKTKRLNKIIQNSFKKRIFKKQNQKSFYIKTSAYLNFSLLNNSTTNNNQFNQKWIKINSNLRWRHVLSSKKTAILVTKKQAKNRLVFEPSFFSFAKKVQNHKNFQKSNLNSHYKNNNPKITKFSVYTQDFYWIPQENFRFSSFSKDNKRTQYIFNNNLRENSPIYLSNRQGNKKVFAPGISGLTRIYNPIQKTNSLKRNAFLISCFNKKAKLSLFTNKIQKKNISKNKSLKTLINYHFSKISKKSNSILNLSIRNQMIFNLKKKFFFKKLNKNELKKQKDASNDLNNIKSKPMFFEKNSNAQLSFKKNHFSQTKQKNYLIAQLPNQSTFFSCLPYSQSSKEQNFKSFNGYNQSEFEAIVKPGWVYVLTIQNSQNLMPIQNLHQIFVDAGKKIINDICFEQNKIYIENFILDSFSEGSFSYLKQEIGKMNEKQEQNYSPLTSPIQEKIKISKKLTNKKCRFFKIHTQKIFHGEINKSEFVSKFENFSENLKARSIDKTSLKSSNSIQNPKLALLFRPIFHKILPNPQYHKTEIYRVHKKLTHSSFSSLLYKDYHSNLFNKQSSKHKFLSQFPSLDFKIRSISFVLKAPLLQLPKNYASKKSLTHKLQPYLNTLQSKQLKIDPKTTNNEISPVNKYLFNQKQKFLSTFKLTSGRNLNMKKYLNLRKKDLNGFIQYFSPLSDEPIFYSAHAIHSFPLQFLNSKPLGFQSVFNIPLVRLNSSGAFKERNQSEINSDAFYWLMKKNQIRNNLDLFANVQQKKNKNKTKYNNLQSLFSMHSLYSLPYFEWSLGKKEAYLANQRLLGSSFLKNRVNNIVKSPTSKKNWCSNYSKVKLHVKNSLQNSSGKYKNNFRFYKANHVLTSQAFASTNFLSPFQGELLTKSSDLDTWWNLFGDASITNKKKMPKHHVFLTKKDMFSVYLPTFDSLTSNFEDSFETSDFETKFQKQKQTQNEKQKNDITYKIMNPNFSNKIMYQNRSIQNQKQQNKMKLFETIFNKHQNLDKLEFDLNKNAKKFKIENFVTKYQNKLYKLKGLSIGQGSRKSKLRLGNFLLRGDLLYTNKSIDKTGQILHFNSIKVTLRHAQPFLISPKGILHVHHGDFIYRNAPVITLPFETLTTGDIVQGIPKVEQYLEARTTQNGRFFLYSLPVLLQGIFERYRTKLPLEQAVTQSFLKIQQIIVDGVQRVYRSQGVSIADKHLEVIVKQMTSKVQIIHGGQTGFFPGELVDLEIVERVNKFLMVKIRYEPIVLGITRASLEVDSFLSAASFQQTTKILSKASLYKKKDFLKGLKENLLVGNLIPAGTGYMNAFKIE
uniref:DNA-directed RNA polymerase subunit beta'' n=1 Tax=Chlorotetraedron incus TaxID=162317 RepID=A0A140HAA2_9CHLO|nr:RNA polymerase beta subunit [Chlorotetraedron incus]AMO01101.1 RNA polymerase beta subunit [Chlorotetraedron incus]